MEKDEVGILFAVFLPRDATVRWPSLDDKGAQARCTVSAAADQGVINMKKASHKLPQLPKGKQGHNALQELRVTSHDVAAGVNFDSRDGRGHGPSHRESVSPRNNDVAGEELAIKGAKLQGSKDLGPFNKAHCPRKRRTSHKDLSPSSA